MSSYREADAAMAERTKPDPEKPWRVAWGFGVFEDFATRPEALEKYESIPPGHMPARPFRTDGRKINDLAIKVEADARAGGWKIFTSRNGNGYWAVGVTFEDQTAAEDIAQAIFDAAENQGDTVRWDEGEADA